MGTELFLGVASGGRASIRHFLLRFILAWHNYLPWKLVPFLDFAAERIYLRKVGGGYIFIHRLLQEYFGSLTPQEIDESTKAG
ncbi:MAG: hypothetical protein WCF84_25585 [Anaerolineae bacterium]